MLERSVPDFEKAWPELLLWSSTGTEMPSVTSRQNFCI